MTDFGTGDGYAGSVKGVIMSQAPDAKVLDITHDILPFNVSSAAYVLNTYCFDFPPGTVHLIVVDPGVGSERKAIVVRQAGRYFVAPDNGVVSLALAGGGEFEAWEIVNVTKPRGYVSATFHGRDIFAPAAAHLASGKQPGRLGPKLDSIKMLDSAQPRIEGGRITGEVIHADRFGNMISNIKQKLIEGMPPESLIIRVGTYTIIGLSATYSDREQGELMAYVGSAGLLEIGISHGSAASTVREPVGRIVTVYSRVRK